MKTILITIAYILLSFSVIQGQEKDKNKELIESIKFKFKGGTKPTIFVDGKKFEFDLHIIDKDQIKSVSVVKGEMAIEKYNSPNGVILITTKGKGKEKEKEKENSEVILNSKNRIPLVIINGKVSDQKTLQNLNTKDIEKINILKGKKALEEYKSKNGVILVTLKKKKESNK